MVRMQKVVYTGDIWQGTAIHPALWDLITQADLLVEISDPGRNGSRSGEIVLGVPHHAEPGADTIAEDLLDPERGKKGRPADESSGLTGLAVFSALQARGLPSRLVIACHPSDHDPNKAANNPYWESVFSNPSAGLLLELHGAGRNRNHELELSAGRNEHTQPLLYGRVLAHYAPGWLLAVQEQPGSSAASVYRERRRSAGKLQNPALKTASLVGAGKLGIPALHLEMKFRFRDMDPAHRNSPRPNPTAWQLANALGSTLEALHGSEKIDIAAADLGLPSGASLIRPTRAYEDSFWEATREADPVDRLRNSDLNLMTREEARALIDEYSRVLYHGLPDDPPEECLWLVENNEVIGRVIFFHWLNADHRALDGQVDYWIRPSRRRQGYGRLILRLLLERFRQLRVERILISCLGGNTASRRIIESSGGVYEGGIDEDGDERRRYWIDIL